MQSLPPILKGYISPEKVVSINDCLIENLSFPVKFARKKYLVVLITGPTGSGTDTVISLLPRNKFVRWRTWTTRQEIRNDGFDVQKYIRVDKKKFIDEVKRNNFIEYNPDFVANAYGTHISEAKRAFEDGRIPVLQVDPTGAATFNSLFSGGKYPFDISNYLHFFIIPPSMEELERRLYSREKESISAKNRISKAKTLLPYAKNAHFIVINHKDRAEDAMAAIVTCVEKYLV